jgi:spermidine/putrescine transport system ATP-binding protein
VSDTPDHFIEIENVTRAFKEVVAVDGISLALRRGEFFSLLGPSGCGKTTTLRMIAGFERPDAGSIRIEGREIRDTPPHRRPVNTVFQSYALFSHLNVYDNVAFGLREHRRPKKEIQKRVLEALALVRLAGYEARRPRQLSGGQQQRVALARAIVNEPSLLLLDEPLGALDLKLRRAMQFELKELQERLGMTFLYVTHDQEEALTMSDRVGVMSDGQLVQVGTPEDVYNRPATRYVADFVGEANMLEGRVAAREGATVRLDLGGAATVSAQAAPGLGEGDQACLILRPERLDLSRANGEPSDGFSVLEGTVHELFFVGTHRKYLIELGAGKRIAVAAPNRTSAGPELTVGDRVRLTWAQDDAWVIKDSD